MTKYKDLKTVLTIAGSDSGGGAGIQADIKTITSLGSYALSVITAITAQNTMGVVDYTDVPLDMIEKQLNAILVDIKIDAIKIGMLSNEKTILLIKDKLEKLQNKVPIVLDPVMVAKGGHKLLKDGAEKMLIKKLMPICSVITPNIPEAEILSKSKINNNEDMIAAGKIILNLGIKNVLMKGGHLNSNKLTDILINRNNILNIDAERIKTKNTHGTGCTMSSAIATGLAQKLSLNDSVLQAHKYVNKAIKLAPNIGNGNGPLNHLIKI